MMISQVIDGLVKERANEARPERLAPKQHW